MKWRRIRSIRRRRRRGSLITKEGLGESACVTIPISLIFLNENFFYAFRHLVNSENL